jgi:hypothetical protein
VNPLPSSIRIGVHESGEAPSVATGWSSPFLASAYYAVETAIKDQAQPAESPITEALARALTAIEDADVELALYA